MSDRSDTDRQLAAIAAGKGREPTAAHPSCTCLASYRDRTEHDKAAGLGADVRACPVHGVKARRR